MVAARAAAVLVMAEHRGQEPSLLFLFLLMLLMLLLLRRWWWWHRWRVDRNGGHRNLGGEVEAQGEHPLLADVLLGGCGCVGVWGAVRTKDRFIVCVCVYK